MNDKNIDISDLNVTEKSDLLAYLFSSKSSEYFKHTLDSYTIDLEEVLKSYFNEKQNNWWCKNKDLGGEFVSRNVIWGFKSPVNSLTLPIWKLIFPKCKILIIQKQKDKKESKSEMGRFFRENASSYLCDVFMNPPHLDKEKDDYKIIQFEEFVQYLDLFNHIQKWIGLKELTQKEFDKLLKDTELEK